MKPEEIRQLLGGYASGTLSEAERKLLFEAALEDQVLFDAMADEQALKDLLDDPESRGYLQAVLDEEPLQPHLEAMSAPASPAPQRMQGPVARRPAMWWGVLAAAALASVSVVGILRLNHHEAPVEMAKNTQPTPTRPAAGKQPLAVPTPAPAGESKPVPPPKAAKREAEVKAADKSAAQPEPIPAPVANAVAERRAEEKQLEAQKPRDESAQAAPVIPSPTQAQAPPPPAPQRKETGQAGALANPQVSQDQLAQLTLPMTPPTPGARQLYYAGERPATTGSVDAVASRAAEAITTESSVKDQKAKKAGPASKAVVPAMGAAGMGRLAPAAAAPGFAMRYKILRKAGRGFEQVLPGTQFHIGDEVVLVIEKNSGGVATIERIAEGSTSIVPLAIQTNELAQSVPLTVTGPMDLALILNRTGGLRRIPERPAGQKIEVADGMVYVAEPAASAGKPLVVHVSIRVEEAAGRK